MIVKADRNVGWLLWIEIDHRFSCFPVIPTHLIPNLLENPFFVEGLGRLVEGSMVVPLLKNQKLFLIDRKVISLSILKGDAHLYRMLQFCLGRHLPHTVRIDL